ncbi:DUF1905 domain-containing protein [Algoriphagus hitonicola]|uniref:Bacteriocin-protection, YdeI or OmpD-Associated n=1 Tax=Algoriphagus hitonicola TaxID=435880 RepID=A0A1I2VNZ6_9BACT|nr:DUF1905 domain-containing protein [Algoriphagus hitonicola]SFG90119.1 protein of unknown function [Algoriphagus hitonicola]
MKKLIIENEILELLYIPGNGAWTYQLRIPNTKDIKGKWGDIKVSGTIDDYPIGIKNLGPDKENDKKLAVNGEIRKSIGKTGGDQVRVTLYLHVKKQQLSKKQILDTFKESAVLEQFNKLSIPRQESLLQEILSETQLEK